MECLPPEFPNQSDSGDLGHIKKYTRVAVSFEDIRALVTVAKTMENEECIGMLTPVFKIGRPIP